MKMLSFLSVILACVLVCVLVCPTVVYAQLEIGGGGAPIGGGGAPIGGGGAPINPEDPPEDPPEAPADTFTNFWFTDGNAHHNSGTTLWSEAKPILVYTDSAGAWLNNYETIPMLVLLSPSKHIVIGKFSCSIEVSAHQVADLVLGNVIDTDGLPTFNSRWVDKSSNYTGRLNYSADTVFDSPTCIPDTTHRFAPTDVYGLLGAENLGIVPDASVATFLDLTDFTNVTYAVAIYDLKFDSTSANHKAGLMQIYVHGTTDSWQAVTPGVNLYQHVSSVDMDEELSAVVQRKGDANLDGLVNGDDVQSFIMAQDYPELYLEFHCNVPGNFNCDMNDDGVINSVDVDLFIAAVLNGGAPGEYWTVFDQST